MVSKEPTLLQYGLAAGAGILVGGIAMALFTRRSTGAGTTVACEAAGGTCVGLSPTSCPEPHVVGFASQYSCGGGVGVECCLPPGSSPGTVLASGTQPVNDLDPEFWSQWLGHAAEAYPAAFTSSNWTRLNAQQKASAVYGAFHESGGWAREGTAPVVSALDTDATARFDRVRARITRTATNDPTMLASLQVVQAIAQASHIA